MSAVTQLQAAKQAPFFFKPVLCYEDYPIVRLVHSVTRFISNIINAGTGTRGDSDDPDDARPRHHRWKVKSLEPGRSPSFVYGATLTPLPTEYDLTLDGEHPPRLTVRMRAVRFGGFRAGGYSNETSLVSILTLKQKAHGRRRQRRGKRDREPSNDTMGDGGDDSLREWEWQWDQQLECDWSNVVTYGVAPGDYDEPGSSERDFLSRAYHTSTLLLNRYLVVLGGMKCTDERFFHPILHFIDDLTDGSILNEAVLDTKSWTWIRNGRVTCDIDCMNSRPSGRHGHSVVLDDSRDRLVLFGGGSGADLLRSGQDNSEVWELQLGDNWHDGDKFEQSFPWKWRKLHCDSNQATVKTAFGDNDWVGEQHGNISHIDNTESASRLSSSEKLCLGRGHNGIKISRDTVLLFFGSGRPSTNGVIAYDLSTDTFFRQQRLPRQVSSSTNGGEVHVTGIFPKPRFTGVAAFLEEDGYIITHGGYCSQDHDTIGTMDVLDLCPTFRGRRGQPPSFCGLAVDEQRVPYEKVTDVQAERGRQDPDAAMQQMLQSIMYRPPGERQTRANVFLSQMHRGELPSNGQSLALMTMIANGAATIEGAVSDNADND
eukprot:jgi/Psemu1/65045/estExt_Genemark1.C_990073